MIRNLIKRFETAIFGSYTGDLAAELAKIEARYPTHMHSSRDLMMDCGHRSDDDTCEH